MDTDYDLFLPLSYLISYECIYVFFFLFISFAFIRPLSVFGTLRHTRYIAIHSVSVRASQSEVWASFAWQLNTHEFYRLSKYITLLFDSDNKIVFYIIVILLFIIPFIVFIYYKYFRLNNWLEWMLRAIILLYV